MSDVIFLSDVRLSFPHIAEPQERVQPDGKKKYSYNCEFIMPKDHPGLAQFMARYAQMAQETWKEHAQTVMQMIQNDRKQRCYGLGEEKVNKKTFQPYAGYAGNAFITVGSERQPQIIQADGKPVDPANTMAVQAIARKLYGGCRVNAAIKPWVQKNAHGNGIRCDFVAIQFLRDDTPFGEGSVDVSNMFGAVAAAPAGMPTPNGMFGAAPAPAAQMPAPPFGMPSFLG